MFVLVHGIGEKLWSEDKCGLSSKATLFRKHVHGSQLRSSGFVQKGRKQIRVKKSRESIPLCFPLVF